MENITLASVLASFDAHEQWRVIEGWAEYQVSSWGSVRRVGKEPLKAGRAAGYLIVTLHARGIKKAARVHILVAQAFHGPAPFESALVAHNNGDKQNCRASNVRWASSTENQADRIRHGTTIRGSRVFGAKLSESDIPVIRMRVAAGERYEDIGADFGVSKHTICLIKKNRIWRHAHGASWGIAA